VSENREMAIFKKKHYNSNNKKLHPDTPGTVLQKKKLFPSENEIDLGIRTWRDLVPARAARAPKTMVQSRDRPRVKL
jgi:hypothetical protein